MSAISSLPTILAKAIIALYKCDTTITLILELIHILIDIWKSILLRICQEHAILNLNFEKHSLLFRNFLGRDFPN